MKENDENLGPEKLQQTKLLLHCNQLQASESSWDSPSAAQLVDNNPLELLKDKISTILLLLILCKLKHILSKTLGIFDT